MSHFRNLDLPYAQKCSISQNRPNSRYLWAFGWVNLQRRTSLQSTEKTTAIHTPSNLLLSDKALSVKSTSIVPFLLHRIYTFAGLFAFIPGKDGRRYEDINPFCFSFHKHSNINFSSIGLSCLALRIGKSWFAPCNVIARQFEF